MLKVGAKRAFSAALAAAVCLGGLASCTGRVGGGDTAATGGTTEVTQKYVDAAKKNKNFNATGDKIVNEKQEFHIMTAQTSTVKAAADRQCVKIAEQKTNVKIKWTEVSTDWAEKTNVVLASGNLPDAFLGGVDLANYVERFVPLNALVDTYAPTTKSYLDSTPSAKAALSDGKGLVRGLPSGDQYIGNSMTSDMWINQQWLDKIGMKIPKTTEELEKVLRAFKNQDPNGNGKKDEIPLSFLGLNEFGTGCAPLFGAFGVPEDSSHIFLDSKTQKVTMPAMSDAYHDCLTWLNKLYKEGLISETCFTESSDSYGTKNASKDVIGAYFDYSDGGLGNSTIAGEWYDEGKSHTFGHVAPLAGPDGKRMVFQKNLDKSPGFLITSNCKNPEVLVRWYDWVNSGLDNLISWRRGPENMAWKWSTVTQEHADTYKKKTGTDLSKAPVPLKVGDKVPMSLTIDEEKAKSFGYQSGGDLEWAEAFGGWAPVFKYDAKDFELMSDSSDPDIKAAASRENLEKAEVVHGVPAGMYTKQNAEERSHLLVDLDTYLKRFVSNSVVNGIDDKKWEKHLNELKRQNAERYIQLCQEAADNIKSRTQK